MSVCDIPVISNVCDAVGEGTASLVAAPFDLLASALAGAAAWLMEAMWAVLDTTTLVDVTQPGFVSVYNLLFGIAVFVVAIFFCLQLITGMVRRDPTALSRAALGAGKSILGSFVVITLTALLLEVIDQLSIGIIQAAGETTETMGDKMLLLATALGGLSIGAPGVGAILTIFLAGLMVSAIAIVWFSLLIRKALILIAVVLAPLALSGSSGDATRGWIGKWAAFLLALIVSKLVLVVVFLVAVTQISTPITADLTAVTEPIAGIVLLGIAAFAPYMVYRVISFMGFDLYNNMGAEQDAKSAMNRPLPLPSKPRGEAPKQVLDGKEGDGAGGAQAPAPKPAPAGTGSTASGTGTAAGGTGAASGGTSAGAGTASVAAPAAAGAAGVAVVGAQVVKEAATAGPKAGAAIGAQADQTAAQAGAGSSGASAPPPPSTPLPRTPIPPNPAPPSGGKE
ncbi:hypothetical protein SAMN02745244_00503 [Tessaracoccus bendigoensis DSM 12906]|uniref:Conjugal transfer protein TrbL n=1 Tax=Tessaracoccus bendigoensis DSM 12906 TaxID=1123357 RepID=A0A1M6BQ14_9ACTN|nr:conjugal transfer protein TrbL [Tessaracoccus bendigoensis]SHI50623.1 hypothetical protein SAMN02745244_00503 [Tessaracoccus bendigoensis DSM 12906]